MIIKSSMNTVGKEIKDIIREKGISRYRVAKDIGIAQESLLRSLKDDANPRLETIKKVLDYLDYEIVLRPKRKEVKPENQKPSRSRRRKEDHHGSLQKKKQGRY